MYARRMLKIMASSKSPIHISNLEQSLKIKERKVRDTIREIREFYQDESFSIVTVPPRRYQLIIHNSLRFEEILASIPHDYGANKHKRQNLLIYFLLQKNEHIAIAELADLVGVSVTTIRSDLEDLEIYLDDQNLNIHRESTKGVKIIGEERDFRRMFTKHVIHSEDYAYETKEYFDFANQIDDEIILEYLLEMFVEHGINASEAALRSILDHIKILLYRVDKRNFIRSLKIGEIKIPEEYFIVSKNIVQMIEKNYSMKVPDSEVHYLASQIAGRTMLGSFDPDSQIHLNNLIKKSLDIIDNEFLTDFSNDMMLVEGLMLHLYPMLIRVVYRIELDNPLIEYVSGHYANVFLVSIRFMELIEKDADIKISKNEMGYIALHFASHLERKKQALLDSYRNIALISDLGRGNALLNKHKLSSVFPKANIRLLSNEIMSSTDLSTVDLFISDCEIELSSQAPFVKIPEILSDKELTSLKTQVILKTESSYKIKQNKIIDTLLKPGLFYKTSEDDYIKIIRRMAQDMTNKGYAVESFDEHVLERESRFSTIYNNGVAGPHGLYLNALQECVGVTLLDNPIHHEGKEVTIIFLINISQGSLFTYREISRLLMTLTNNPEIVDTLIKSNNYREFKHNLESIEY